MQYHIYLLLQTVQNCHIHNVTLYVPTKKQYQCVLVNITFYSMHNICVTSSSSIYYPGEFSPLAELTSPFTMLLQPSYPLHLLHYSPLFHVFLYHVSPSFHWPASLSLPSIFNSNTFFISTSSSYNMSEPPQSFLSQMLL